MNGPAPFVFMACITFALYPPSCLANKTDHGQTPNIILIMTDDMGYGDLGIKGNPHINTPHIDRLASQSAEMTSFYVSPVCAPTRASLMTGRYNYRTGVTDTWVGRAMMDTKEVTLAEVLQQNGYTTGIFGKWHLGDAYPMRPMDQGFDESLIHLGGGIGQPSDPPGGSSYFDPILQYNGQAVHTRGYCTDVYFDAALKWIKQNRSQRFFAYLPTNAPHGPFQVPESYYAPYRNADLSNERFPQTVGHKIAGKANTDRRARIFGMITNIDDNVGRLLSQLDVLGLSENTLVLFMTDNGPNGQRYNAGMRAQKGSVYEGGIRTVFFARWPNHIKPGHQSDRIAAHIDVMPTLLDACHIDYENTLDVDGRSLLPLLTNRSPDWPDRSIFFQWHRGDTPLPYRACAVRSQNWKLVQPLGIQEGSYSPGVSGFELYDMTRNGLEMHNVADDHPGVMKHLIEQYDNWLTDVGQSRGYHPPRIHLGSRHQNPITLTRQDWRKTSQGGGWEPDARGHWLTFVTRPKNFDFTVRFPRKKLGLLNTPGTLELVINKASYTASIDSSSSSHQFRSIQIPKGNARIEARFWNNDKFQGVYQIVVSYSQNGPENPSLMFCR